MCNNLYPYTATKVAWTCLNACYVIRQLCLNACYVIRPLCLNACYVIRPLPVLFKIIEIIQNHGELRSFISWTFNQTRFVPRDSQFLKRHKPSIAYRHASQPYCLSPPYHAASSNQHFQQRGLLSSAYSEHMSSIRYSSPHAISPHWEWEDAILVTLGAVSFRGAFAKTAKSDYSFPSSGNNSAPAGRNFITFGIWVIFENLCRKFQVSLKSNRHFTWRPILYKYFWSHFALRMRNISHRKL